MAEQGFTLTSPAFVSDGLIPAIFTCDGENKSPELHWIHPPDGTKSFVLIVDDPDAPNGTFTHWVLFDIPATMDHLPTVASDVGVSGRNDFQQDGYGGPCPPPNHGQHRYFFKLFALKADSLNLQQGASRAEVEQAVKEHLLEKTELMGRYERTTS
jgi:Raf kinase inhibitor-like YbhB/YbcL family protein